MITNEDRIKDGADILAIVSRRVPMKQKGTQWKGLCPFHAEKTGSFTVTPAKNLCHCFGCGKGGDAVSFIMQFEGKTYPEALEIIAAESGIICEYDKAPAQEQGIPRQDLYKAAALAAEHYAKKLQDPKSKDAIEYLYSRGFTDPLISKFQLGYSRSAKVAECGADKDAMLDAGILGQPLPDSKNQDLYDPLAGRIIIPLHDALGRVVAFTARKMPGTSEDSPKYKNTRETKIFKKGECLYGYKFAQEMLRTARKDVKKELYILEGQLKTVAALNAGFAGVAPGGTAFTARQAALVDALNPEIVYLVPDSDAAGIQSAIRSACELRKLELNVKIACLLVPDMADLPAGKIDTDDLMAKKLPITFEYYDLVEWLLLVMCRKPYNSPDSARAISDNVLPVIHQHPNPIIRETEINLLSSLAGISQVTLASYKPAASPTPAAPAGAAPMPKPIDTAMTPGRYLCASLLQIPPAEILTNDNIWYLMWINWPELPIPLLQVFRKIVHIHKHMVFYRVPAVTAIQTLFPGDAEQFNYWLSLPDIEKADIPLFERLQPEAIEHFKKINQNKGGSI